MKKVYMMMVLAAAFAARAESKFGAVSPDGLNEVRLETGAKGMSYSVWRRGKALVEPTVISLVTSEHGRMNGENADPNTTTRKVEGKVATPIYKKSEVDLAANETRVDFGDWAVVLHARNDGVAWRFETKYDGEVTVTAENTNVRFPKGTMLCYGQVGGFATSFERPVTIGPVESVKSGHPQIVITPLTASVPGAGVVCIMESNLLDYPGLNFYRRDGETDMLRSWQAGVPSETERKGRWIRVKNRHPYLAKTSGTRVYPWRVFVLGDTPSDLVSSDAVYALAEPCRLADTSWVKPGLVQWDWWHGFKITDVPGLKSGCNYETYRAYIDYASASGIPYIIMDEGWSERLNLDKPRDAVNVEGVINYGKEKGVGVILWAAWAMLYDPADRARIFDRYAAMGAKGFKIDFMDRDDQDIERFLENTASDAAKRKLIVMYHGVHKPTGLCRTFPNVLNYEGVYGLEQGHSRGGQKVVVANDVNLPYTRMVAGAMDYTPGAMRNRAFNAPEFQKGKDVPSCYGTRCHQLALFPIFEAPVQMLCDSPTQYRSEPECAAFIAQVPTVWDETVGVAGEIGAFASVARRKDRDWWLGAITNWEKRELELPTKFLGEGEWKVEAFEDAADADVNAERYVRREFTIRAGETIKVKLAPGGGFAAKFTPASKSDATPYVVEAPASAGAGGPKIEDFKVKLTGVAAMPADDGDDGKAKVLPPQTRIVVQPGNLAVFFLEYSFPPNVKSRMYLGPNFDKGVLGEDPFGTSASGLLSGKGKITKAVILGAGGDEPYAEDLLLKSVRITGELEAEEGAPRNNSFFICDIPVDVLFANNADSNGEGAKALPPKSAPAPDPKLGVVPFDKNAKPKSSTPAGFTDNLDEALAKAKKDGKFVYVCFSGSDWCGWCQKLEREVFAQPEFIPAVEKDYVLVFIDFPGNKGVLSDRAKKENPKLVKKYGIEGFPTALILDGDGKKVGETGYRQGGAEAYARHLMAFRANCGTTSP